MNQMTTSEDYVWTARIQASHESGSYLLDHAYPQHNYLPLLPMAGYHQCRSNFGAHWKTQTLQVAT